MVRNSLGRLIPETFAGKKLIPYSDPWSLQPHAERSTRQIRRIAHNGSKLVGGLREAIIASGLKDGMTISTHHSLRNGDYLLNDLVKEIDALGIRDIKIASSSVHVVHAELIPYIRKGVITSLECGVNGPIGEQISKGELDCPIIVRSHGGRARSLITGEVQVDVAFLAAQAEARPEHAPRFLCGARKPAEATAQPEAAQSKSPAAKRRATHKTAPVPSPA